MVADVESVDDAEREAETLSGERVPVSWIAVVLILVVTVGAALAVSFGLARERDLWLVFGAVAFAPVLVVAMHSATRFESSPRAAALAAGALLVIVFIIGIVASHPWWTESSGHEGEYALSSTDDSAHVYLHAKPGGPELTQGKQAPEPLVVGRTYTFSCAVELGDDTRWLRLADTHYWAPATPLRPQSGSAADLPGC